MTDDDVLCEQEFGPLLAAIGRVDQEAVRHLISEGHDVNARAPFGEPLLFQAIWHVDLAPASARRRCALLSLLMDLGADPHMLGDEEESILIGPILAQDEAVLTLLLERGVDPNRGCAERHETAYDAAEFDYVYEAWISPNADRGGSSTAMLASPDFDYRLEADRYVRFLDDQALMAGRLRPRLLYLLREFGAKSQGEIARDLTGDAHRQVEWRDGVWRAENPEPQ